MFGQRDMCLSVSFSSRMRNMALEHFLNVRNRITFENREYAEISGNSVKMDVSDLQNAKNRSFSRYLLEILLTYTPKRVLPQIFRFLKVLEFFLMFLK